jgi:hypothetical protein
VSTETPGKAQIWGGRVASALPVLALLASGAMKLTHNPEMVKNFVEKFGFPEGTMTPLGLVEITSAILYAVPQTSALGAVLLTGYLGGAVATHVRVGEGFAPPIILGMIVWLGLYLRDARVRALLPLRKPGA